MVTPTLPFLNSPSAHVFRFVYKGAPRPLKAYLLERYAYGRDDRWAEMFYPCRIRLNGQAVDDTTPLVQGDAITYLHLREEEPQPFPPSPMVLYEDDWMMVLLKGDLVPVNPAGVYYFSSFALSAREAFSNPELTPIHRLDLETSGPVVFAKRKADISRFHQLFVEKSIQKRYLALVTGDFPSGLREISGLIAPHPASRIHTKLSLEPGPYTPRSGVKQADGSLTRVASRLPFNVPGHPSPFTQLELEPVTGKTNQLRVHLAHVGHPIVGDKKYHPDENVFLDWVVHRDFNRLADRLLLPRQALHCTTLDFPHPFESRRVEIRSPVRVWDEKLAHFSPPFFAVSD
ncbi:MAG: RluA family pseudouridine synthase [Deltaproteobacteria bacterium]|nr:RluA family pseudouridine synthase [Deltaproteobacteria bacterium]